MEGEAMRFPRHRGFDACRVRALRAPVTALAAGLLLAGCVATPVPEPLPAMELQLLDAGALAMPPGCEPARGVVYRTAFVVQPNGRVDAVASESGAGCVQEALLEWVSTFQYRPVDEPTAAVLDWMGVTASRGG
jgi:hypothetical protein